MNGYDENGKALIALKEAIEEAKKRVSLKRKIRQKLGFFIDLSDHSLEELESINSKL